MAAIMEKITELTTSKKTGGKKKGTEVASNPVMAAVDGIQKFGKDSYMLIKRCTKPDAKGGC
jgi:hypothetical protein